MNRDDVLALDAADPLAPLREQFSLPANVIYLDGNSLGALPKVTAARLQRVVTDEWGEGLIRSWNTAGWYTLARRLGDKIARLVGVGDGELVVADSTSVNLFKVLSAALTIVQSNAIDDPIDDAPKGAAKVAPEEAPKAAPQGAAKHAPESTPARRVILSERSNFPTDLYIAESLARERGFELRLADVDELPGLLDESTAVLMLTHVNYRTGRMHDMRALTSAAHAVGALTIWDLAHSAGAVPVDLHAADADFAIGCGYKFLNGGPGAPAFVWASPRHAERFWQPLTGWMGHAAPFEFTPGYRPAPGIARYLCGTPPLLSLAALECGIDTVLAAEPMGGMNALREKSLALSRLFASEVEARCPQLTRVSPADDALRGSQASFAHPEIGYAVMQALIARGVIGDFRAPDILRFGFTPLYVRHVDAFDAAVHLQQVLESGDWQRAEFNRRGAVT